MNLVQKTIDLQMNGGLNCAQAILTVYGHEFGVDADAARLLGRPWGGGMAQQGLTCGYLTGAALVLAQVFRNGDETQSRRELGRAVRELFARFRALRGTTLCRELLEADMSTVEGARKIKEEKLVKKTCCSQRGIGRDVAEILESLLASRP